MYQIYHNSRDENHHTETFKNKFIEICNEHRDDGRAMAFAFIIYNFGNPHINKVLTDTDYWNALNKISGNYLTVFSIHYKRTIRINSSNSHTNRYMDTEDAIEESDHFIEEIFTEYFNNEVKFVAPSILFFQVNDHKVDDSLLIELDETKIEESFNELKDYFDRVANTFKEVKDENKGNSTAIFNLLKDDITTLRLTNKVSKFSYVGKTVGLLIRTLTG